jgi:serine/threonine-protein kinase
MNKDFNDWNKREWAIAIKTAFPKGIPSTARFTEFNQLVAILEPFCKLNLNHTMLPDGGGMDIVRAEAGREDGCIDLWEGPRAAFVCRPSQLIFEYIVESPADSFLLLETAELRPSGIYEDLSGPQEELVELADGTYHHRSCWDGSCIGRDENGDEIPLPQNARLVFRYLTGKFLFVAKASAWNLNTGTQDAYAGRHSRMSAREIREAIQVAR